MPSSRGPSARTSARAFARRARGGGGQRGDVLVAVDASDEVVNQFQERLVEGVTEIDHACRSEAEGPGPLRFFARAAGVEHPGGLLGRDPQPVTLKLRAGRAGRDVGAEEFRNDRAPRPLPDADLRRNLKPHGSVLDGVDEEPWPTGAGGRQRQDTPSQRPPWTPGTVRPSRPERHGTALCRPGADIPRHREGARWRPGEDEDDAVRLHSIETTTASPVRRTAEGT